MKDEISKALAKARQTGRYMVAVWYVEADKLQLTRQTVEFPFADIPVALRLLREDLDPITLKGPDEQQ